MIHVLDRTRTIRLGGAAWVLTILYFPIQLVVALAWPEPYSLLGNTISDLGVTSCGASSHFPGREAFACSPLYPLMNAGLVLTGVLTILGAILTWRAWPPRRLTRAALLGVILGGAGGILVGLAPSDAAPELHSVGALLQLPGVLAPLLLGISIRHRQPRLAFFSVVVAAVSMIGTVLFALRLPPEWFGLLERLALDPFTVWTFVLGIVIIRTHGAAAAQRVERTSSAQTSRPR